MQDSFSQAGGPCQLSYPWYAIWVRSRHEKIVSSSLAFKDYETFVPLYRSVRRSSGPMPAQVPLLPGYVFCRFDISRPLHILTTPGVVSIVSAGTAPLPVLEDEINALKTVVASGHRAEPWPHLTEGERVRIEAGPLRNLEGVLVKLKNDCRLIISVTLLQRSVGVEIGRESVVPIRASAWRFTTAAAMLRGQDRSI